MALKQLRKTPATSLWLRRHREGVENRYGKFLGDVIADLAAQGLSQCEIATRLNMAPWILPYVCMQLAIRW